MTASVALPMRAPRLSWQRRRLTLTRAGTIVIALCFAVGFAALNTGNNLLFFGWGLLLSSILVSGILSEATLRSVHVEAHPPHELRAGVASSLPFVVHNQRRLPAYAVDVQALLRARATVEPMLKRAFLLRLVPGERRSADVGIVPRQRGTMIVEAARVYTAFPFGFFEKEKRVVMQPPMALLVFPARVQLGTALAELLTRLGETPARRAGAGDELFSLRPFRTGDDPRRIAWRRSAKTGRVVVKESEAARSHDVLLELVFTPLVSAIDLDNAAAVCGSLAEDLLAAGHAVGLCAGTAGIAVGVGPRQRSAMLAALAVVAAGDPCAERRNGDRAVRVAVVARGASAPRNASVVIDATSAIARHGQGYA